MIACAANIVNPIFLCLIRSYAFKLYFCSIRIYIVDFEYIFFIFWQQISIAYYDLSLFFVIKHKKCIIYLEICQGIWVWEIYWHIFIVVLYFIVLLLYLLSSCVKLWLVYKHKFASDTNLLIHKVFNVENTH
jgi:hypothetical protein